MQEVFEIAKKKQQSAQRRPRSDARQNHERILEAAKAAFTRHAADASLDEIARQPGVGAGTVYRHFPTRDALIESVYRREVEKLAAAGRSIAADMPRSKPCAPGCCCSSITSPRSTSSRPLSTASPEAHLGSIKFSQPDPGSGGGVMKRAKMSGDVRRDVDASELLRAVIGVSYVAPGQDWQESARRLLDILIAGSRPAK